MTVTATQVKAHLDIRDTDRDTYIADLIARATAWVERFTGKNTVEASVVDTFTEWGDFLTLSRGPFVELTSIAYVDADGEDATLAGARVQDGKVYPPASSEWPSISDYSTITVTYDAGYATTPVDLDAAMLLLIQHWFEPDEKTPMDETHDVPIAVVATAGPFRTPTVA
jgi:uncharacterized phiE125 gp8 family phage protein